MKIASTPITAANTINAGLSRMIKSGITTKAAAAQTEPKDTYRVTATITTNSAKRHKNSFGCRIATTVAVDRMPLPPLNLK